MAGHGERKESKERSNVLTEIPVEVVGEGLGAVQGIRPGGEAVHRVLGVGNRLVLRIRHRDEIPRRAIRERSRPPPRG